MASAYSVLDIATGQLLTGEPAAALIEEGLGEAWQPADDPDVWHLRADRDPQGVAYRLVRVIGPDGDPNWFEDTVENLDTSEG